MKEHELSTTIEWFPVTESPEQSGYVLLAITHHNIPIVLMGFCRVREEDPPVFTEETFSGKGVNISHWAKKPEHPWELSQQKKAEGSDD